jgi:hypothetical protein
MLRLQRRLAEKGRRVTVRLQPKRIHGNRDAEPPEKEHQGDGSRMSEDKGTHSSESDPWERISSGAGARPRVSPRRSGCGKHASIPQMMVASTSLVGKHQATA